MTEKAKKPLRCGIYTRKSTEHGLELEFNSLDAQREACENYIKSQSHEGWSALAKRYDDPAFSGGNLERPVPGFGEGAFTPGVTSKIRSDFFARQ